QEYEQHASHGATSNAVWGVVWLAEALLRQGRIDAAAAHAQIARDRAGSDDVEGQFMWRYVFAGVALARGDVGAAEQWSCDALALIELSEAIDMIADAYARLALVLRAACRPDDARQAAGEAYERYARRGNVVSAERLRAATS